MARQVTRAQLRRLRDSLRDGRRLAIITQSQLLAAYRSYSAGSEQLSQLRSETRMNGRGFTVLLRLPKSRKRKPQRRTREKRRQQSQQQPRRFVPTQILGRRTSVNQRAQKQQAQQKSRVVTIEDLASLRPVTQQQSLPPVSRTSIRAMSSVMSDALFRLMR